ncbi:MAG: LysM peptidoglycan-binding domain-containing protein [Thermodesulfobacteriota bacterium]|nr:LysM peptidoglycan-binding domain-containing protein [Thermodesulfobacteriota bacterium]
MKHNIKKTMETGLTVLILISICIGCVHIRNQQKRVPLKASDSPAEPESSLTSQAEPVVPIEVLPITIPPKIPLKKPTVVQEEPAPNSTCYIHKVRWYGENLSIVSKWYTGKFTHWKAIADANPGINPNRIFVGNKIFIPQDLLNTSEPMPEDFVSKFIKNVKQKESPAIIQKRSVESIDEEKTELFGLREYRKK